MNLADLNGVSLDLSAFLPELRRLADYIFFEGPLLSHFRGPHGTSYFRHWCDIDSSRNRWMLFEVSESDRLSYLGGHKSLRELMLNEKNLFVYFIDTDEDGETADTCLVPLLNIPSEYVPRPDSFYKFRPANVSKEEERSYTILIDDRWSFADLGDFRSLYERSYSFIFALQEMYPEGQRIEWLKYAFGKLPWKGGFNTMHFFREVVALVPRESRPKVASMQYASPGWIELQLSRPVAFVLRDLVNNAIERRKAVQSEISAIHDVLRDRKLLGNDGKSVKDALSEEDIKTADALLYHFCGIIKFPLREELLAATPNPLAALKILISFTRRLWNLVDFGVGHKVKL